MRDRRPFPVAFPRLGEPRAALARFACRAVAPAPPALLVAGLAGPAAAEDGYELWLRYRPVADAAKLAAYRAAITSVAIPRSSATLRAARDELRRGLGGLLGKDLGFVEAVDRDGVAPRGHPGQLAGDRLACAGSGARPRRRGGLRPARHAGRNAPSDRDRRQPRHRRPLRRVPPAADCCRPNPRSPRWTSWRRRACGAACSTTGTTSTARVERGYAGRSLWDWHELPGLPSIRATRDYARANASIGINGTVLNNVNANATSPDARVPAQGRRAGRRVPALWHPRLPHRPLQRADRDRRPGHRRSAGSRGRGVVEAQGRRDLPR